MTSTSTAGQLNSQDKLVYNIRLAEEADVETVLGMGRKFYTSTEMGKLIPFDDDAGVSAIFGMLDSGFILLAEVDGVAVGMMGCQFYDFPYNRDYVCCTEMMFWLEEEHRGGTIAARFLKEAELLARHEGASYITMLALETSPEMIDSFYKRMGYQRTERTYIKGI